MHRATRIQHVATAFRRASTAAKPPPRVYSPASKTPSQPVQDVQEIAKPPSTTFHRSRALPWVLSSLFAGAIAFYGVGLYVAASKPCQDPAIAELSQQQDVSGRYEETANTFDSEVGISEMLMGVNGMRKRLAKQCTGHVLEVSCGTGRNLGYFDIRKDAIVARDAPARVESLTFVDLSPQMIEVCLKKWHALYDNKKDQLKPGLAIRFKTASALGAMPPAPTKQKYDTIIQTMGLCSTPMPVELLTNMVKHLDTSNPDARILLLEHGRSYRDWLNNILDSAAEKHAEIHGCWFNRDIGALVEDAARLTGMEVVSEVRHHIGTTWIFELKPGPELSKQGQSVVETPTPTEQQQQPTTTWRSWLGWK